MYISESFIFLAVVVSIFFIIPFLCLIEELVKINRKSLWPLLFIFGFGIGQLIHSPPNIRDWFKLEYKRINYLNWYSGPNRVEWLDPTTKECKSLYLGGTVRKFYDVPNDKKPYIIYSRNFTGFYETELHLNEKELLNNGT